MKNSFECWARCHLVAAVLAAIAVVASPGFLLAQTNEQRREVLAYDGHEGLVKDVAYSPDGKRIASGGEDRVLRVWDSQDGRDLLTLKGHTGRSKPWRSARTANG